MLHIEQQKKERDERKKERTKKKKEQVWTTPILLVLCVFIEYKVKTDNTHAYIERISSFVIHRKC